MQVIWDSAEEYFTMCYKLLKQVQKLLITNEKLERRKAKGMDWTAIESWLRCIYTYFCFLLHGVQQLVIKQNQTLRFFGYAHRKKSKK